MDLRSRVELHLGAAVDIANEKNLRGNQMRDLALLCSVIRVQTQKSATGKVDQEDLKRLAVPTSNPCVLGGTTPYYEYIRTTLMEVKAHQVLLHSTSAHLKRQAQDIATKLDNEDIANIKDEANSMTLWSNLEDLESVLNEIV